MSKRPSQVDMLEHSKAKVDLLKLYLTRYLNILSLAPFFSTIRLYDLFCGEGRYPNGGKGSPLVILDAIKSCLKVNERSQNPSRYTFHFNDVDQLKVEKVRIAVEEEQYGFPAGLVNVTSSTQSYSQASGQVVVEIAKSPNTRAFVFIDPYGYKDVTVADVRTLLDTGKAEVLLFLPISHMYRFSDSGTPDPLDRWLTDLVPDSERPFRNELDFVAKFKAGFERILGSGTYVEPFTIKKDAGALYALFFFTRNELGMEKMLEVKWHIDKDNGQGWKRQKVHSTQITMEFEPRRNEYAEALWEYISAGVRSNSDIYLFTLQHRHLPRHTNEVLEDLQEDGAIVVEDMNGQPARKKSFYVSYPHHKGNKADSKRVVIRKAK